MARKPNYSDEELAMLSDEEREGMLDPDLIDDPINEGESAVDDEAAARAAAAAAEAAEAAARQTEADAAKVAEADAAKKAADAAAASGAQDAPNVIDPAVEPEKDTVQPAKQQIPAWEAPENAQERIDEIDRKKDELHAKFDDGELTSQELRAQLKPLDKEAQTIRDGVFKAQFAQDWQKDNYFQVTVPKFLKDHAEYSDGSPLFAALDAEVRKLQAAPGANPFDPAILEKAHATVRDGTLRAMGIDPATLKTSAKPDPTTPKRVIPPSLAHVPAADISEAGTVSRFEHLDKLSGTDFEDALAKLSEADRDTYLSGG